MNNDLHRALIERQNFPDGITAELIESSTRAFCRIYFDGERTNFCLDESGKFFYLENGIPIRSSRNIIVSVYQDFKKGA
jgi:hypothetical protein